MEEQSEKRLAKLVKQDKWANRVIFACVTVLIIAMGVRVFYLALNDTDKQSCNECVCISSE